jgi:hypothetical protein
VSIRHIRRSTKRLPTTLRRGGSCIFAASKHEGQGVARAAVSAALDAVARAGGGIVEAYPEQTAERPPLRGAYLHTGRSQHHDRRNRHPLQTRSRGVGHRRSSNFRQFGLLDPSCVVLPARSGGCCLRPGLDQPYTRRKPCGHAKLINVLTGSKHGGSSVSLRFSTRLQTPSSSLAPPPPQRSVAGRHPIVVGLARGGMLPPMFTT